MNLKMYTLFKVDSEATLCATSGLCPFKMIENISDHEVWQKIMLTQQEGLMNVIGVLQIALLLPVHLAERK